jgi:glycosyltransferase involved in cell wall biosynthesis
MPQQIVYLMNTDYPNQKAHSIQITKILFGLSKYTDVIFICNKITTNETNLYEEINNIYGYDLRAVKIIEISKKKLTGFNFYFTLNKLKKTIDKNAIFYTRSYSIAKRLIRTKFIHKRNIILESHKKSGYYKEDTVTNSRYSKQRKSFENNNRSKKSIQKIYSAVDGVVFTSNESKRIAETDLKIKNTTFIWHPLNSFKTQKIRDLNIIYLGSLAPDKLIELLLDALAYTKSNIVVDMLGGHPEHQEIIQKEAKLRGVQENLRFLKRVPPRQVPDVISQYRYGLSMMEGLKVADYIECGLIPIIPRIKMYSEIFKPNDVIFFEPDSAKSLNESLNIAKTKEKQYTRNTLVDTYGIDQTALKIINIIQRSIK